MFKFENVTKTFKEDFWKDDFIAVDDMSFEVKRGSLTGFLANGAGKTTSIKILLGLISPDSGKVKFDESKESMYGKIGYIPERPYFYPYLTGQEFLNYLSELSNLKRDLVGQRIEEYSTRLDIKYALTKKISEYSKGMLQRLGFVSSLLNNPDLLIYDEPTSGLDPIGRKEIKDFLIELNSNGKTVFVSSHIVSDLEQICSDLVVIEKGKLLYEGDCKDLIDKNTGEDYFVVVESKSDILEKISKNHKHVKDKYEYLVNKEKYKEFIKACTEQNIYPTSVSKVVPSLEEIIYKIS